MYHSYLDTVRQLNSGAVQGCPTIFRQYGLSGVVEHPRTVPECPSNYGTRDTQTVGLSGVMQGLIQGAPPSHPPLYITFWIYNRCMNASACSVIGSGL